MLAALAICAFLMVPATTSGFSVIGGSLDLSQRDFRVFDNFTDPEANDNTTPDPNFPGHTGAVLAIWKASVEWGSDRHGDGRGDPTQAGDLGSGGANYDPSFQGLATSVGGVDDNVHSEISGAGGGGLAFTEIPISDGWRIRYFATPWVWEDGPGVTPFADSHRDLQGVATHEMGHALGLGHSTVAGATMTASGANLTPLRAINHDDIAGVQSIYGVRSANKPSIESYLLVGTRLEIRGKNFSSTGNEVWFTRNSPGDGTPVKVSVDSTAGGTRLDLSVPAQAGPGDILVKQATDTHASLSAAYPFDPDPAGCNIQTYGTGKLASNGVIPRLGYGGSLNASVNDFRLKVDGALPFQNAVLFSGRGPAEAPFLGGTLLVAAPLKRELAFQIDFFGSASLPISLVPGMLGAPHNYQVWIQDPGDPLGAGLTNAIQVTFCP